MNLEGCLVKYGTEAILEYRRVCLPENDNEVRELFIWRFLLPRLRQEFGVPARAEVRYLEIAEKNLRRRIDDVLEHQMAFFPRSYRPKLSN